MNKERTNKIIKMAEGGEGPKWALSNFAQNGGYLAIGLAASTILGAAPTLNQTINSNDQAMEQLNQGIDSALMSSGNPWLMAIGAADSIIGKTGGKTDASKGLGTGNDIANAAASMLIPGAGYFTKSIDPATMSGEVASSVSYGGVRNTINNANQNSGKILFGRRKAQQQIAEAQAMNNRATTAIQLANENNDAMANSASMFAMQNQMMNQGNSMLYNGVLAAKHGDRISKIITNSYFPQLKSNEHRRSFFTVDIQDDDSYDNDIDVFKEGGQMTNVIPSGALHKERHHLEDNFDDKITLKGIPVITKDEEGKVVLHAEIERNELTLNKETTDNIKQLRSKFKFSEEEEEKQNILFEVGDFLVYLILKNTEDNTGLIKTIKA